MIMCSVGPRNPMTVIHGYWIKIVDEWFGEAFATPMAWRRLRRVVRSQDVVHFVLRKCMTPRTAARGAAKSTARLRRPPFPPMQDQRDKGCQRQHGSKPDSRIAGEDRCERRAACGPRHLREAEQGRREAGLVGEWR